jgi:hypothetical protein
MKYFHAVNFHETGDVHRHGASSGFKLLGEKGVVEWNELTLEEWPTDDEVVERIPYRCAECGETFTPEEWLELRALVGNPYGTTFLGHFQWPAGLSHLRCSVVCVLPRSVNKSVRAEVEAADPVDVFGVLTRKWQSKFYELMHSQP